MEKINQSGSSCVTQVRQNAFSALMEKKPKLCAVLKIEASVSITLQNKNLKMTFFEWFFRVAIFNLAVPLLPTLPPA